MIIYVTGAGYVSRRAAEDLLTDFVLDGLHESNVTFVLPSYISDEGLKNVKAAVDTVNRVVWPDDGSIEGVFWKMTRVKKTDMPGMFTDDADDKILMVLDASSVPEMVKLADACGIKVYDLSKGLFPVSPDSPSTSEAQMPLDEAESDAEALLLPLGYDVTPENPEPSQAISAPPEDKSQSVFTSEQREEIERIVQGIIAINRPDLHPVYKTGSAEPDIDAAEESVADELFAKPGEPRSTEVFEEFTKVRYYRSKTGKMRKANKSKARPGEEETWLTAEQEAAL